MDYAKLRKKLSDWDFSKYTHTVEEFKSTNGNTVRIDHLRNGNSNCGYVRFVNDDYGMAVFGDFGNWIFCRPFIPSEKGYVCVSYWNEKLKISSCQDHAEFDSNETEKELNRLLMELEVEKGEYSGRVFSEIKEFYNGLLRCVDNELEYTYMAYCEYPSGLDPESIPFEKKGSAQLLIVFDAYNVMCGRVAESSE